MWFSKYRWNIVIAFFLPILPIFTYKKLDIWKYPMISVIKEWFYLYHTDFFHKFHAISVKFVKNCRKCDIKCCISCNLRTFLPNRKYRKYRVIIVSKPKISCNIVWTQKKDIAQGWSPRSDSPVLKGLKCRIILCDLKPNCCWFMKAGSRPVEGYFEDVAKFLAMAPRILYSCV